MSGEQRAILVRTGISGTSGLNELNDALSSGWHFVHACAMGGTSTGETREVSMEFAALVVIERSDRQSAAGAVRQATQEEIEEALEEVDDNGTPEHLPGQPPPRN